MERFFVAVWRPSIQRDIQSLLIFLDCAQEHAEHRGRGEILKALRLWRCIFVCKGGNGFCPILNKRLGNYA